MKILLAALLLSSVVCSALAQSRVPWTTSQVAGSPEPPRAFVSEQILPQLPLREALELATVPGSDRLIVVERRGRLATFSPIGSAAAADELIDLLSLHANLSNAYGVVLHPLFRENRQIFVCYALRDGLEDGTRVSRFTLTSLDPLRADPGSEEIILTFRAGGHNGANLRFGPDGYLYISTGDAGPAAPPDLYNTGQDTSDLLSSILRIDVDRRDPGRNYRVPPDNPWASPAPAAGNGSPGPSGPVTRPEIWAYGLRNPWKMSFDRATGNLWCGDVGWELWEMVHLIRRGGNYGWSAYEAGQPIKPQLANPLAPISAPIVAHGHAEAASITGGFVYHGKQFPELTDAYVYGDFATGKIWALWHDGAKITRHEEIADTPHSVVTFGETDDGELYYLHYGTPTTVHRLVRNPQPAPADFPRTLSATGLFADVPRQQPAAGVYPFTISSPMWNDGATASRWVALRGTSKVTTAVTVKRDEKSNEIKANYATKWPTDAVLARTLTLGQLAPTPAERTKPIETQLLHYDGANWNGYSYRWNEAGTDAELVPAEGAEVALRAAADAQALGPAIRSYQWRFHSRADCLRCHNSRTPGPLAFSPTQLAGGGAQQPVELIDRGLVDANFFEQTRLVAESSVGPAASARAVLTANCAHCHTAHAGGAVSIFLNPDLLTGQMNVVGVEPSQGGLGLKEPKIIAPGDPWNSVLVARMAKLGTGHMPLIGAHEVDVAGLKVIEDWIARMPADHPAPPPWAEMTWDRGAVERELVTVGGALRLRRAIDDGKLDADLRAVAFKLAWTSPESTVRDIYERFKPDENRERTLGPRIDAEELLRLRGDPVRGAALVGPAGKLASCQACHFIEGKGRHFGPDLSKLGARQTPAQILESILSPAKTVAAEYRPRVVELRDGTTQVGFVLARAAGEISLTVPTGPPLKIRTADIKAQKTLPTSLMPEGQLQGVTPQEAADLLAYLANLK